MKPSKITLVTSSLTCGGAEKNVALLANAWAKNGKQVSVVSFDKHPPFFTLDADVRLISTDITRGYRSLWKDFWTTPARVLKLRRVIAASEPDVVVSFMDVNNLLTLLSTIGQPFPVVVSERSDPYIWPTQWGWRFLRRLLYPRATRVITQTEGARAYFAFLSPQKVIAIPNPIAPAETHTRGDEKHIVSVGRLVGMKRYDMLVRSFAELSNEFPDWTLDVVGDGEERAKLESLTAELTLQNRVRWHGTQANPSTFLQKASIFVLCSDFEGFPNALAEAMAAGVASISTDTLGGRHLIQDRTNGFLVSLRDQKQLTSALRELMSDPKSRQRMGMRAKDVSNTYSFSKVLAQWDTMLNSLS